MRMWHDRYSNYCCEAKECLLCLPDLWFLVSEFVVFKLDCVGKNDEDVYSIAGMEKVCSASRGVVCVM